jgi:hypothetical protein
MGAETIGSKYATNKRRADRSHVDEFELHTKNDIRAEGSDHQVVTSVQAARSASASQDYSPSDTNSEEIILQKQDAPHGIMLTRDVTVRYTNK